MKLAGMAAVAVACFAVGWSVAAPVAPTAADQTLGMAYMFAAVRSNGALVRGSGVTGAAGFQSSAYEVTFERSVLNCSHSATVAGTDDFLIPLAGFALTAGRTVNPNTVFVQTTNAAGNAPENRSFHLVVFCPK